MPDDTIQFGQRTWRNQVHTDQDASFLLGLSFTVLKGILQTAGGKKKEKKIRKQNQNKTKSENPVSYNTCCMTRYVFGYHSSKKYQRGNHSRLIGTDLRSVPQGKQTGQEPLTGDLMGPVDRPPTPPPTATTTMANGHNIKLPFKFIFLFPYIRAPLSHQLRVEILFVGFLQQLVVNTEIYNLLKCREYQQNVQSEMQLHISPPPRLRNKLQREGGIIIRTRKHVGLE